MEWRDTVLDVAEEMAAAAKAMHGAFAAKTGVRLKLQVSADAGRIRADRDRVRQMVLNLLSNAIKYTAKGHVRLVAASSPAEGCGSPWRTADPAWPGWSGTASSEVYQGPP
jgi:signal transduction histidine kinase